MYSTASVACKNWHPDTTSGTYLPQNTREASYAIFPIEEYYIMGVGGGQGACFLKINLAFFFGVEKICLLLN